MDHKDVIPASYQDFDDKSEESESEEDENGEEEDVFEAEEALSGLVYKPLLPGGGDDELDDVEDMESFEEGAVCPLTPLLPYRVRENIHLSEGECWLPSVESTERDEEDQGREERGKGEVAMEVENDGEEDVLGLVIPLVSIVITQPTPESERRKLEEEEDDEDDDVELEDLVVGAGDEQKAEAIGENKENTGRGSKAGNSRPTMVGSKEELEHEAEASLVTVTPLTPVMIHKVFEISGGGEIESDEKEEEEREAEGMAGTEVIIEANPDSFKENVKLEDDAKDGDGSGKGGGARKKRRSSLFSAVAKATSILRYFRGGTWPYRFITPPSYIPPKIPTLPPLLERRQSVSNPPDS